jgi:hypothetical protein
MQLVHGDNSWSRTWGQQLVPEAVALLHILLHILLHSSKFIKRSNAAKQQLEAMTTPMASWTLSWAGRYQLYVADPKTCSQLLSG